jgi:tetratricopeptide (TPR) repeat protein
LARYQRAVERNPGSAEAWHLLSGVLGRLRRLDDAIAACEKVLALDPGFAPAMLRRGAMLGLLGRHREAVAYLDRLLGLAGQPASFHAAAHLLKGDSLRHLGEPGEAVAAYDRAIGLRSGVADVWVNRGKALRELGEVDDALDSFGTALEIDPRHLNARNERGMLLGVLCREAEAEAELRRVLAADPGHAGALNSLGVVLQRQGRIAEAIEHFQAFLRVSDDPASARFNVALCLLLSGDFSRGLPAYEARWQTPEFVVPPLVAGRPRWTGDQGIAGMTVLLHPEQGLGDTIQFCRYAPMAADLGARVILGAPTGLKELLQSLDPRVEVVGSDSPDPVFDLYCPLMSLPLAFRTRVATIPARVAYLSAPDANKRAWRARLGPKRGPRVGIAWSGNDKPLGRSVPLDVLAPVLSMLPEAYCLQQDLRPADVPALAMRPNILVFGRELRDFSDTAALIDEMDLVISIDTAVLHLAGALGRPAWGMLPFAADWRWLRDRADTPWYPTMRLFRQARSGDWGSVVEQVEAALRKWLGSDGFAHAVRFTDSRSDHGTCATTHCCPGPV